MTTPGFELREDSLGRLTLIRPGVEDAGDVRIRRAFPWSCADRFISIRSSEGRELVLLEDMAVLDELQRRIVLGHLSGNAFLPRITHIDSLDVRFGYLEWRVRTDRGPAMFRVQEREDIRFMPDGRFAIKDADGTIYSLPRLDELDAHSLRAVEALL